jgi:hypothetical protein
VRGTGRAVLSAVPALDKGVEVGWGVEEVFFFLRKTLEAVKSVMCDELDDWAGTAITCDLQRTTVNSSSESAHNTKKT